VGWRGIGGGRGAESYDHKKAWPSVNHSILSLVRVEPMEVARVEDIMADL
jgi:hypothetical protein